MYEAINRIKVFMTVVHNHRYESRDIPGIENIPRLESGVVRWSWSLIPKQLWLTASYGICFFISMHTIATKSKMADKIIITDGVSWVNSSFFFKITYILIFLFRVSTWIAVFLTKVFMHIPVFPLFDYTIFERIFVAVTLVKNLVHMI